MVVTSSKERTGPPSDPAGVIAGTPCLVLLRGGRLGGIFRLKEQATLGRDERNTIVLDLPSVSRQHARISQRGDAWVVMDAGSRNGTYLNERAVEGAMPLVGGDLLQLGDVILKFLEGGDVERHYHEEIYRLTIIDPLTELHNKRSLVEALTREVARAIRHHRPLSIVMLDLDRFKKINDRFGHVAGDHALRALSKLVKASLRHEELASRYGGDEFVFVLPETEQTEAYRFAERTRQLLADFTQVFDGEELRITASLGVATLRDDWSAERLLQAADDEAYRAKRAGGNRTAVSEDPREKPVS